MDDMPTRVAECLNEKNPYMNKQRVLYSRIPKKKPRQRFPKRPTTSSERNVLDRYKEQQRREVKQKHPNASLKWNGHRWEVRKQKIEEKYGLVALYELSLRTGAIAVYLAKVKQYASAVDKGVMKLKSLSASLKNVPDEKERNRIQSEIVRVDADVLSSLRKMQIYSAFVSASGGLGADRTYKLIKKMEKKRR